MQTEFPFYIQQPSSMIQLKRMAMRNWTSAVWLLAICVIGGVFLFYPHPSHKQESFVDRKLTESKVTKVPDKITDKITTESPIEAVTEKFEAEKFANFDNDQRREKIKEMFQYGWDWYVRQAWGANEVKPETKIAEQYNYRHPPGTYGASILAGLDTQYLMGFKSRYGYGRQWITAVLAPPFDGNIPAFEMHIEFIGGMLSTYALTTEERFKNKAIQIADAVLPAFNSPSGIPQSWVKSVKLNADDSSCEYCANLIEKFQTVQLEFEYLSYITGNEVYAKTVRRIRDFIAEIKPENLLKSAKASSSFHGVAAIYQKYWQLIGKTDEKIKKLLDTTIELIETKLVQTSTSGLTFLAAKNENKMNRSDCTIAGILALQSQFTTRKAQKIHLLNLAKEITRTCHESYIRTETHLGPETFRFSTDLDAKTDKPNESSNILMADAIETYFYMWRVTKDQKYRDWAWDAAMAIEKYTKCIGGYSGIVNVDQIPVKKDNIQPSHFLGPTLKFLYLIFSPDSVLPLNSWVFNAGHPFPVFNSTKLSADL